MNRIDQLFGDKRQHILNLYYTAGFPGTNDTLPVLESLEAAGADMAEIGIPFSDSLADGPVIQLANEDSLARGMSLKLLFAQLKDMRKSVRMPVILMGSLNPVLQYGMEAFLRTCQATGIDGVILPDLPLDEYEKHYAALFASHGIHAVFLVTPETSDERLRRIDSLTGGFLYAVSSSSTTGTEKNIADQQAYFQKLRDMQLSHPILVGFGIKDRPTFEAACRYTNGAVIGTAFINLLRDHQTDRVAATDAFISQIKTT